MTIQTDDNYNMYPSPSMEGRTSAVKIDKLENKNMNDITMKVKFIIIGNRRKKKLHKQYQINSKVLGCIFMLSYARLSLFVPHLLIAQIAAAMNNI